MNQSTINEGHNAARASMKKHVLFVITQSEIGGAQQFLARLAGQLDKNIFRISIIAGPDGSNALKSLLPEGISYSLARHLKREPNIWDDISAVFELRHIIKNEQPDILFLNSSKAGFIGTLAARLLSRFLPHMSVIYRIGGWSFNDPLPEWRKIFYRWLERLSARWKDYIIVNNLKDYHDAQRLSINPNKKLLLIHNGIDPYMNFLNREEARARLFEKITGQTNAETALTSARFLIGTIANFYAPKGLPALIQTARLVPGAVFIIIGGGRQHAALQAMIEKYKLTDKVFLAGQMAQAWKYMPAFDAFVLPSFKEGFPWVILEAMAAKVPVIATHVGAMPEIIADKQNGLMVQPGNPQALASAIENLMKNEGMRRELPMQAHQTVIQKFSLQKMTSEYAKLFNSIGKS